jgi:hypothetical protein
VNKHKITQDGQRIYTINTTPSIDYVYVLLVLSYFVFVHAKYWLCICVARLELFCVCSRQVLIMYMCCLSWVIWCLFTPSYIQSILGVNKHKITQDGQHIYIINTWREQTQNNSIQAPQIPCWVILCLFTPNIDCVYVLPVFLCLFTPSIDCVFVFPVLSYFVFVHAKYWLHIYNQY